MLNNTLIGESIKKIREYRKLTQRDLAGIIGKTEGTIRKYENGSIEIPLSVLDLISQALDYPVLDLISHGIMVTSPDGDSPNSEKLWFYENLCKTYFKGILTWSKDRRLSEEQSMDIQSHLSELLLRYKLLVEDFIESSRQIELSYSDNEIYKRSSLEEQKRMFNNSINQATRRKQDDLIDWINAFSRVTSK